MDDHEFDQDDQEFEVEITDLDDPGERCGKINGFRRAWVTLTPRLSSRRRRALLLLVESVLILGLLFFLFATSSTTGVLRNMLFGPTPTPTTPLYPGADLFYIFADLPWGQIQIDRHATALSRMGVEPPLHLAHGQHVLTWQAAPFLPQRCILTVPPTLLRDTCSDHGVERMSGTLIWVRVVRFSESLSNLPVPQRTQLVQAAQAALDARQSNAMVRVGELYARASSDPACKSHQRGYQCYATAKQPLRAALRFQLDTDPNSQQTCIDLEPVPTCSWNYYNCHLFCGMTFQASTSSHLWDVFATVLPLWTFTTLDGQVLERDVSDDSALDYATGQTLDETLLELHITSDLHSWHVALSPNLDSQPSIAPGYFNPICAAATQLTQDLEPTPDANGIAMTLQWQYLSGSLPASGCLAVGTPQSNTGSPVPTPAHTSQTFTYLWRFGVLLALNRSSYNSNMQFPLADSYEQQIAQWMLTNQSGLSSEIVSSLRSLKQY